MGLQSVQLIRVEHAEPVGSATGAALTPPRLPSQTAAIPDGVGVLLGVHFDLVVSMPWGIGARDLCLRN